MTERTPLPVTPELAAARRARIARLRTEIAAGTYRVAADEVAAAVLDHARLVRRWRTAG